MKNEHQADPLPAEALAAVITRLIAEMRRDYGGRDYWGVPWADRLEAALAAVGRTPEPKQCEAIGTAPYRCSLIMGHEGPHETDASLLPAVGRTPREEPTALERIPEFVEPRYWIEHTFLGWGVFYRQDGRKLGVGCVQNVDEVVARSVCKTLNDVLYEEVLSGVAALRAGSGQPAAKEPQ